MADTQGFNPLICETLTSPTNIAVIKYWGKDSVALNTPMNSSASITLDQSDLHTITTIAASTNYTTDRMWLNGKEVEIKGRLATCLREVRKLAQDRVVDGVTVVRKDEWPQYGLRISSVNTFPTGAGLASSAAGLACFVATLAKLYGVPDALMPELTAIARQGSGSASRSMYGGFVEWRKGELADGSDSIAIQHFDENYWPEIRAVILVVSDKEKDISSTAGMQTSRDTSVLLAHRAAAVVQPRLDEITAAYGRRDFETFGRITMQDSNQFHAVCLDTYPPIFYMNDVSRRIIGIVHALNEACGRIVAAYTFDAGPNAVIYTTAEHRDLVLAVSAHFFPAPREVEDYCNEPALFRQVDGVAAHAEIIAKIAAKGFVRQAGDVKYVYSTKSGPGPQVQPASEHLLDSNTGLPVEPGPKHKRMQIKY